MKSNPDTEEIAEFTEEVERVVKRMKVHKAHRMDGITSSNIKIGGGGGGEQIVFIYPTNIFNINKLKTRQIPDSWNEAKLVILFKKGDPKDIKNYRPISFLSHATKYLQNSYKLESKPRGCSAPDPLQALHQIIEKPNEYNRQASLITRKPLTQ